MLVSPLQPHFESYIILNDRPDGDIAIQLSLFFRGSIRSIRYPGTVSEVTRTTVGDSSAMVSLLVYGTTQVLNKSSFSCNKRWACAMSGNWLSYWSGSYLTLCVQLATWITVHVVVCFDLASVYYVTSCCRSRKQCPGSCRNRGALIFKSHFVSHHLLRILAPANVKSTITGAKDALQSPYNIQALLHADTDTVLGYSVCIYHLDCQTPHVHASKA